MIKLQQVEDSWPEVRTKGIPPGERYYTDHKALLYGDRRAPLRPIHYKLKTKLKSTQKFWVFRFVTKDGKFLWIDFHNGWVCLITATDHNAPQRGQIVTTYHNGDRLGHNGTAKRSGYKLKPSDSKTYLIHEKHLEYKLYTINGRKCQSQSRHIRCKNQHQTKYMDLIPIVYSTR